LTNPVVLIFNETNGDLEYALRIQGNTFKPKIFTDTEYLIKIGSPEENLWKEFMHVSPAKTPEEKIAVQF
jgi:hypothetical protein